MASHFPFHASLRLHSLTSRRAKYCQDGEIGIPAASGRGRIDALPKVTGAKLYASDFRAADLPGWPQNTSHAMLIRTADATHVLTGIDVSLLTGALKPSVVVTADDLARIGARVPEYYAGDLLCPVGKTPLYLGQPVAMLIFEDFDTFDQARLALRDQAVLKFGAETGPVKMPNYGQFRFTRVGGPTPDAPDVYSPSKNGWVSPGFFENSGAPIWPRLPVPSGAAYAEAASYGEKIRAELDAKNPALLVLDREFETQSVDPMALEPESGLAWYDAGRKNLNLVISVQSPAEIATAIAYLLGNAQAAFKPAHINTNFASCGGGFGGRDHTPFPLYVALAGMFFPNRPVRLANNRFEQFQLGIKRHAFKMRTQIGVDRATGKIVGFAADHALDGGGLANFSAQVASVGALAALGIYYAPKVDLTTYVYHSRGVTAGSMRCYGTIQTMTALEVQVDEICTALPLDPIEFRRRNALAAGNRTWRGTPTSCRSARPKSSISWRSIRSGRSAPRRKRVDSSREFSSVPASRAPPRTTAPAVTLAWDPSKSRPTVRLPFIATALRWATVSERRWPIGSRRIWAVSLTKSR